MNSILRCYALFLLWISIWVSIPAVVSHAKENKPSKPSVLTQSIYSQGTQALRSGDYSTALTLFKQAINLEPEVSQYHYALSMVYAKLGDSAARWQQLRQTLQLNPQHPEAMRDQTGLWQKFRQQGLFEIGTPAAEVRALLGKPDHSKRRGNWQGCRYGDWLVEYIDDKIAKVSSQISGKNRQ